MKLLVCGYFGFKESILEGQRVKTRSFFEVAKRFGETMYVDTAEQKEGFIAVMLQILRMSLKSDVLFMLPGKNGLLVYFPMLYFIAKIQHKRLFYPVVGGWLSSFLKKRILIKSLLKRIDGILVESKQMVDELTLQGFKNVHYFPNFRNVNNNDRQIKFTNGKKIVFLSRVDESKGIFLLIQALNQLRSNGDVYYLDIYGPVSSRDEKVFFQTIMNSEYIKYNGILNQSEICDVLKNYDAFVFPSFYEGECFPGVFMDAKIAGVPILASDWRFNCEFVNDGRNGLIFKSKSKDSISECIHKFFSLDLVIKHEMRRQSFDSANDYSFEMAETMLDYILRKGQ